MRIRMGRALAMGLGATMLAGLTALAPAVVPAMGGVAYADGPGGGTDSLPVSFDVVSTNNSGLPCATFPLGGQHFTVRGHLTGPGSELHSDRVDGTLYSHGDGYDETFWRYEKNPDYNYVEEMAHRGHVSVSIDRLGYGDSDKPNGNSACFGTEADVLHQIIGQLRRGDYHGDASPRFGRVGLVGHSASGLISEQEAAGFHDIDALGVLDSGEASAKPLVAVRVGQEQARCLTSPDGYAPLEASDEEFASDHLYNVEPDVARDLARNRSKDACAGLRNSPQAIGGNGIRNSTIKVPVLLLAGANDKFFGNLPLQAATYAQSPKVTVKVIPETGHAVAFSREHRKFDDEMNAWLDANHL
ncbi:MAG TPA: alpha/beta fold hydrolase [Pseudonocardia sp.]|jgi:pimeloyl-ACP methyl ester carboxylesterase